MVPKFAKCSSPWLFLSMSVVYLGQETPTPISTSAMQVTIKTAEGIIGNGGDCGKWAYIARCKWIAARQLKEIITHLYRNTDLLFPEILILQWSPQTTFVYEISPNLNLFVDSTKHICKSEPAPTAPISDPGQAPLCLLQQYRGRPVAEFQANIFHSANSWLLPTGSVLFWASGCMNSSHSKQTSLLISFKFQEL